MTSLVWQISLANVKNINKHAVLDLIRFGPGGVSRIELSRQLGLTRAGVSVIVTDLIRQGLVRESRDHVGGGRTPISLEINPEYGRVIGVDIGSTHVYCVLTNFLGQIQAETEAKINISDGPAICLPRIREIIFDWLNTLGLSSKQILSFAVGVPGPVVTETGMVSGPPTRA